MNTLLLLIRLLREYNSTSMLIPMDYWDQHTSAIEYHVPRYDVLPVTMLAKTTDEGWAMFLVNGLRVSLLRATPPPKAPTPVIEGCRYYMSCCRESGVSWSTVDSSCLLTSIARGESDMLDG